MQELSAVLYAFENFAFLNVIVQFRDTSMFALLRALLFINWVPSKTAVESPLILATPTS